MTAGAHPRTPCAVYALFRSRIRQVDTARRAALRKQLLQQLLADTFSETLDLRLDRLSIRRQNKPRSSLPPPSDDQQAWWNEKDGSFKPPPLPPRPRAALGENPFDGTRSSPPSAAGRDGPPAPDATSNGRRPVPALPSRAPQATPGPAINATSEGSLIDVSEEADPSAAPSAVPLSFQAKKRQAPPVPPNRTSSPASTKGRPGEEDVDSEQVQMSAYGAPPPPERLNSTGTGESWQMLP